MILGFTGTRHGMTEWQKAIVRQIIDNLAPSAVHHGCCVGSDYQFAELAYRSRPTGPHIVGWPCKLELMVSQSALLLCDEIHDPQPPLVRNRCIVDRADRMIACPAEMIGNDILDSSGLRPIITA